MKQEKMRGDEITMKMNVAVLFGGRSVEHEVSIISAQQAIAAMDPEKYNIIPIYVSKKGVLYSSEEMKSVEPFKKLDALLARSNKVILVNDGEKVVLEKYPRPKFSNPTIATIDVAVPVMHGTNGEDGTMQGYLEMLGVPYAGCGVLASAVGMDKILMKQVLQAKGIPVLDCVSFYAKQWALFKQDIIEEIEKIGYPLIVKPANLGSSVGIKKANNRAELEEAVDLASSFATRVLVEKAIENLIEINCSVMGNSYDTKVSVCERPMGSDEILSYADKYGRGAKGNGSKGMSSASRQVPADISDEQRSKIETYVQQTFQALCCSGVSRIDCMIDGDTGEIYVNEINTIPGSLSFYLWEEIGLSFRQEMDELIALALKKNRDKEAITFTYDSNILEMQGGAKGAKGGAKA